MKGMTKMEIEVKILEIDKGKIISILENLDAKKKFEGDLQTTYFDYPGMDLRNSKRLLRIRKKGNNIILTAKETVSRDGIRKSNEYETVVEDFEMMRKILKTLGFIEYSKDLKHRTSYKIKNSLVEIDEREHVPTWLEVESPNDEELKEIVVLLGYTMEETSTMVTAEVYKKYGVKL